MIDPRSRHPCRDTRRPFSGSLLCLALLLPHAALALEPIERPPLRFPLHMWTITDCRVQVEIDVDTDGSVRDVRVVDAGRSRIMARSAQRHALQWRYPPQPELITVQAEVVYSRMPDPDRPRVSCITAHR